MTWKPIETAPRDGTEIVVYRDNRVCKVKWDKCGYNYEYGWATGYTAGGQSPYPEEFKKPTHWMELPEPPQ